MSKAETRTGPGVFSTRMFNKLFRRLRPAQVASMHPADLAVLLAEVKPVKWPALLERLEDPAMAGLVAELPGHLRRKLVIQLGGVRAARVIQEMPSDEIADLVAGLPGEQTRALMQALSSSERNQVRELLGYPKDTAGGLMQVELIKVAEGARVPQAVEAIRCQASGCGPIHFVYVVDGEERLVGAFKLSRLILAKPDQRVYELMSSDLHTVNPEMDQETVAHMFRRYDLVDLAVVDEEGRLLGRILHDDAVDVLSSEAEEDMLHVAGASPDGAEQVYSGRLLRVASLRLPWLFVTMAGLMVSALLYGLFQSTFPHMLILIPFIPVISAMGGNMGSQSSIIVVRGIATGKISGLNILRHWRREVLLGIIMGMACGLLAGAAAMLWRGDLSLALVVAAAMGGSLITAATMGVVLPFMLGRLGVDPAIAAGPFVTTLQDILATLIYFFIALAFFSA